jgi:hypothetical protein
MGKHLLLAICWGLATWTWLSMAAVLLHLPNLGLIGGVLTALGIMIRSAMTHRVGSIEPSRQLADHPK